MSFLTKRALNLSWLNTHNILMGVGTAQGLNPFPASSPSLPGTEEEKAENARTFRAGGYYRFRDHAKHVRILVVNSGLWAPRYDNSDLPRALPDAHMVGARRRRGSGTLYLPPMAMPISRIPCLPLLSPRTGWRMSWRRQRRAGSRSSSFRTFPPAT